MRALGVELPHEAGHVVLEAVEGLQAELLARCGVGRVQALGLHSGAAVAAGARQRPHDVEEEAVGRQRLQDFPHVRLEEGLDVGRVQAQLAVEAGLERGRAEDCSPSRPRRAIPGAGWPCSGPTVP